MSVPEYIDDEAPDFPEYQRVYVVEADEIPEDAEVYTAPFRGDYFLREEFR